MCVDTRQASRHIGEDETYRRAGFGSRVAEGCLGVIESHNRQTNLGQASHIIAAAAAEIEERLDTICVQERAKDSRPLVTPIKVSPCLVAAVKKVIPIG